MILQASSSMMGSRMFLQWVWKNREQAYCSIQCMYGKYANTGFDTYLHHHAGGLHLSNPAQGPPWSRVFPILDGFSLYHWTIPRISFITVPHAILGFDVTESSPDVYERGIWMGSFLRGNSILSDIKFPSPHLLLRLISSSSHFFADLTIHNHHVSHTRNQSP